MQSGGPAGSSDAGDDPPTREEFRDALAEISGRMERIMEEKLERIMDALPRVVPEAPPAGSVAAAGGGGESRGGRHAPPGAGSPPDQAPNITRGGYAEGAEGLLGPAPSEGEASRGSERHRTDGHYSSDSRARIPRLKQLSFNGHEKTWPMFKNDFTTHVQTCGMTRALKDSRDIVVLGMDDAGMVEQGVEYEDIPMYRDLWSMLTGSIVDDTTKMMVYQNKGPSAAWRALEQQFAPLTGGEQISLIGEFYTARQGRNQDPRVFYQKFMSTVTDLELAFKQPIPKMLTLTRFIDGLSDDDYDVQKQNLLSVKDLDEDEMLRVLRTRYSYIKGGRESKGKGEGRANQQAFMTVGGAVKKKRGGKKKTRGDEEAFVAKSIRCHVCSGNHYASACPRQICQRCGGKGHNVKDCASKGVETAVLAYAGMSEEELDVAREAL